MNDTLTLQQHQARQDIQMIVPIEEIDDRPQWNCRGKITTMDVEFLLKDIPDKGLMFRPLCRKIDFEGYKYRVVAGFSRVYALKVLRWKEIPISVRDCNDEQAAFLNLSENLTRKDLHFMQEAEAVRNIGCRYPSLDDEEIGKRLGQNRQWVQVRLFALNFPEEVKDVIRRGWMTYDQIRHCHKLKTRQEQLFFVVKIKEARERGMKLDLGKAKSKKIDYAPLQTRTRVDIFAMQEHIVDALKTNNFGTRCLAWAAGEISDIDLFGDIANIADNEEIMYKIPHSLSTAKSVLDSIREESFKTPAIEENDSMSLVGGKV